MNRSRRLVAAVLFVIVGLYAPAVVRGQGASGVARLRALNHSLLGLQGQFVAAEHSDGGSLHLQAAQVIAERSSLLQSLIRRDPATALELAFDSSTLASLRETFPAPAGLLESRGTWTGPVEYIIFDDATLSNHLVDVRMRVAGEVLRLHFEEGEPTWFQSNDILEVSGLRAGAEVAVGNGRVAEAMPGPTCTTLGDQKTVVILVQFPDDPATTGVDEQLLLPAAATNSMVTDIYFQTGGRSVDGYWRDASYNRASASGVVVGPVFVDRAYTCNETGLMRQAAINAVDAQVNFPQYTRVMIIFPRPAGCAWGGLGTLGCSTLNSADGSFVASTSWNVADYMTSIDPGVKLGAHEAGHNLTLHHANTRYFTDAATGLAETLGPVGTPGTNTEYGDYFSIMGAFNNHGHYAAPHKQHLGWFGAGNVQTVEANGTFSIQPFENVTDGVQALKVRRGTGNDAWLWLEFRQDIGIYDSSLGAHGRSGALVHHADASTGTNTHLIDFTPTTANVFSDAAKLPGTGVWVDPYSDLTFSVDSLTGTAPTSTLEVTVAYVAPNTTMNPIGGPFAPRAQVRMSATSSIRASGSSVVFTMIKPNGTATRTVAADANGVAAWTYRLGAKDPRGTYRVTARSTFGGQQGPVSNEQTFVVQ